MTLVAILLRFGNKCIVLFPSCYHRTVVLVFIFGFDAINTKNERMGIKKED